MAIEQVTVPKAGESITEATLNRWFVANGAFVKADAPLFEMGTDKASQEVVAPASGVVKHLVKEGDTVTIGATVAHIDTDAKAPAAAPAAQTSAPKQQIAEAPSTPKQEGIPSPAAARVLAEAGVKPGDVAGTGPGGRILKEDAVAAASAPKASPVVNGEAKKPAVEAPTRVPSQSGARTTREPMSKIRKTIATRLLDSQNTTATLTTFNEADMTAIQDLRAKYNEKFEKKHGTKIGFMSVFVKAAIEALKAFPLVNARLDGNDIVHQHFYDIGVAVSTEKGLMVPVIRGADQLGFADIEKAIAAVAKRARDGKVTVPELEGGTFTITNGGIFGSMLSTPILNPPQCAILGMHSIQKRPVVLNDQIVIRPMMYLALSYDHRLIDGREAVQFLVRIKECVENPERILFEI
ncbi:dihydrolipoamide succinyltransferase : Dihydrolipoyllysine-residue succinyltransferase component of 2-oxoglutarate dehydrogenase complex OS=Singulisphaera acidiphila (strain ATCC BAA-1392 / DSM 18658 / VKM B-2454 / MOB10) GN=Sinac_6537 PE=3 SV=1: Biotin_lipoyl: E3_binding: 2-oxoacid_dh [Gemmata massiliana]|uniref:Dihydrolipoyllysine-residue succinyltransferase component of 2-oxoglutarate dehydrogenase complex n=1 Tax=Gemmata massiliana TaxID=1210884 RepID=A0A6P2DK43_9BACT|nr:2-oxoglutarate dehydrogenase complex dihydrolipoyllysine-residue succinyltransferase [Gemmata massiliana]VTS02664.1 dihydrolipoamide succinyltransferase : Dihydrolipoyllysine-residue succinyltransferase component of 2-oxoglutarate dehydrogenase complex OS=Singulisphaera acidiphila (strain ATCC BAA-1392 / DSM 18658 / VKM B-2454 / MOB10) GN=Sinac_6537 PE=3 SV=1: Biotin_lipoyl: E3_binding: 2-oxoacid_dh [Gemmata massiliana]